MSGTRAGGLKTKAKVIARFGKDYYRQMGHIGGRNGTTGGFACLDTGADGLTGPERARVAGAKGGKISRRGPARPIIGSTHESSTDVCGRAYKDGEHMNMPGVKHLVTKTDKRIEVMGWASWRYHYQGHEFNVRLDSDPRIPLADSYRQLPLDATKADIKQAQEDIANAIWRHYHGTLPAPQYLPVRRLEIEDGYIYELDGAQGASWFKSSNKLEME